MRSAGALMARLVFLDTSVFSNDPVEHRICAVFYRRRLLLRFVVRAVPGSEPPSAQTQAEAKRSSLAALAAAMDEIVVSIEMTFDYHLFPITGSGLPPSSAISTRTDTSSPPAIVLVQPVSQSLVFAGRSRIA
jgi:hypothetical protein